VALGATSGIFLKFIGGPPLPPIVRISRSAPCASAIPTAPTNITKALAVVGIVRAAAGPVAIAIVTAQPPERVPRVKAAQLAINRA
jgi:hypothetical protein